jgi:hypothetical protein
MEPFVLLKKLSFTGTEFKPTFLEISFIIQRESNNQISWEPVKYVLLGQFFFWTGSESASPLHYIFVILIFIAIRHFKNFQNPGFSKRIEVGVSIYKVGGEEVGLLW